MNGNPNPNVNPYLNVHSNPDPPFERRPKILARIDRPAGVSNLTDILKVVDGVVVSRGELGLEMGIEGVAYTQNRMAHPTLTFMGILTLILTLIQDYVVSYMQKNDDYTP